jgi:hypothetical protein
MLGAVRSWGGWQAALFPGGQRRESEESSDLTVLFTRSPTGGLRDGRVSSLVAAGQTPYPGVLETAPRDWPAVTMFLYDSRQCAQSLICFP